MADDPSLLAELVTDISRIAAEAWNACAGPDDPFVSHAFLAALEASGAVGANTGWHPRHILLRDHEGRLLGAMPCYLKSHSMGEYVFDHAWADAWERAGGSYYPKLQSAVPFTPVTGPRLLVAPGADSGQVRRGLLAAGIEVAGRSGASSFHITFLTEAEARDAAAAGLLLRTDRQFHWINHGYRDFDDFLATLTSRKRKQIRKERAEALAGGIEIDSLSGAAIAESDLDDFFAFYLDTGSRKWGRPYLNRATFSLLRETMADRLVLIRCRRAGKTIAGALNFLGAQAIYGRWWGCVEDHPFLHFEACYYRAIDQAIARRLARVEAGAQGPHKLARGYEPTATFSVHHMIDPGFHDAVRRYLDVERRDVDAAAAAMREFLPFRKG